MSLGSLHLSPGLSHDLDDVPVPKVIILGEPHPGDRVDRENIVLHKAAVDLPRQIHGGRPGGHQVDVGEHARA